LPKKALKYIGAFSMFVFEVVTLMLFKPIEPIDREVDSLGEGEEVRVNWDGSALSRSNQTKDRGIW
jgi:hypothetical protein